jgi:hypothetical protein
MSARGLASVRLLTTLLAGAVLAACGGLPGAPSTSASTTAKTASRGAAAAKTASRGAVAAKTTAGSSAKGRSSSGFLAERLYAAAHGFTAANDSGKRAQSNRAGARFVACMRENSISYPTRGKGATASKGLDTASPSYQRAASKCGALLHKVQRLLAGAAGRSAPASPADGAPASAGSTGSTGSAAQPRTHTVVPASVTRVLEKFTACMREHGVTNFPAPEGAEFDIAHLHLDTSGAQYKAAERACNDILRAVT